LSRHSPFLFWSKEGAGSPLLLVHGFAGRGESWAEIARPLAEERAVISLHLPGHHPSHPAPPGASFDELVDRLADRVRQELPIPIHGAGYSMGGRIVLAMLARHPDLFWGATLIGASPGIAAEEEREQRRIWDERWADLLERGGIEAFVREWERLPLFQTQARLTGEILLRQRSIRLGHDPKGLAAAFRALALSAMPDYTPHLARIAAPVLLAAGEEDPKFVAIAEEMVLPLRRGSMVVIPSSGHNVPLERPDILIDLFRRHNP